MTDEYVGIIGICTRELDCTDATRYFSSAIATTFHAPTKRRKEEEEEEEGEEEDPEDDEEAEDSSDDENVDNTVQTDMQKLSDDFPSFAKKYRLIKRIGEGMLAPSR